MEPPFGAAARPRALLSRGVRIWVFCAAPVLPPWSLARAATTAPGHPNFSGITLTGAARGLWSVAGACHPEAQCRHDGRDGGLQVAFPVA